MSPLKGFADGISERFPRTRGDEPALDVLDTLPATFSPHTRG